MQSFKFISFLVFEKNRGKLGGGLSLPSRPNDPLLGRQAE